MTLKRRHFLMFLGAGAGSLALQPIVQNGQRIAAPFKGAPAAAQDAMPFLPVKTPMPLESDGVSLAEQVANYSTFAVQDDLVLPEGYTYDVIGAWGDPVGDSRFGYNNDYLSFVETASGEGFLTINFEYISGDTWMQTYEQVIGQSLPFAEVQAALEATGEEGIDAYSLPDGDPLKAQVEEIAKEALIDLGIGVVSIRREADGSWVRTFSDADRRITGITGMDDERYLSATGPAVAVFTKESGQGYMDGMGNQIIGTFNNCAGGTTPWGTVFSAEENFQNFVPETVYADGTSMAPESITFTVENGLGSVFGYAGNKYGWMVEVDPANPDDYGIKHTWLGRYRHEAVAVRAESGQKLAFYSGCDRRGGHLYKFVSNDDVSDPTSKSNSELLEAGMLYAAKFNPDGTGSWIPLEASTPINPDLPSAHAGGMITLPNPDRQAGGIIKAEEDAVVSQFTSQFSTLADLYTGDSDEEVQGAILIDAHFAGNAVGATCTARPEDTDIGSNGSVFIAFTSGGPGGDGSPNSSIFQGPNGEDPYEHGWIMRLDEDGNDPAAMTFTWELFATGGEPAEGGMGFSNPDNLEFDSSGNLWMVTDMSTSRHNFEVPSRIDDEGNPVSQSQLRGLFGNNSVWYFPTSGPNAGKGYVFAYGPMECEMCGPFVTSDESTIFLAAQHPGETHGIRMEMASEMRMYAMQTTEGEEFMQQRDVPIGSNWPAKTLNAPPRPATVAVRRIDGEQLV
ncbi:PhoX family protein [Vacuolonema iberomarrocanum]|uniref:PhoX family protein n=1 Tax=Vacuolonema iberomarrocanum TaxID=3454632 RepID=UPI0019F86528|nr:DUF839 domain-containing protein [filamentous cyanobacterium LEGE 07170]